ncbi:MAG: hypothetical protein ACK417_09775 [Bacteroidia bacterium]
MFRLSIVLLAVLFFSACERPMYMGGPETNMLSSLTETGDMQFNGSMSIVDFQTTWQISGEIAATDFLGIRGHWLGGGDSWSETIEHFGRVRGFGVGVGGFYQLPGENVRGSSWIGMGEGGVRNVSGEEFIGLNRYNRYYVEQQLSFKVGVFEFVTVGSLGISHVYGFELTGQPVTEYNRDWYAFQVNNPRAMYGQIGQGMLIGADNLRLNFRADWMFGPGRSQVTRLVPIVFSTGLSYRIGSHSGPRGVMR